MGPAKRITRILERRESACLIPKILSPRQLNSGAGGKAEGKAIRRDPLDLCLDPSPRTWKIDYLSVGKPHGEVVTDINAATCPANKGLF